MILLNYIYLDKIIGEIKIVVGPEPVQLHQNVQLQKFCNTKSADELKDEILLYLNTLTEK